MKVKLWTRRYIMALIAMFGIYMVSGVLLSVMAIHAKNLTGLDSYAGMMVTSFTLGALAVRFLAGGLIDRFGSKKVILAGIGVLLAGSVWLLMGKDITQIIISRTLQGVGFGLSATATSTLIATICHPSRLLEGISYSAVAQSLTSVIGPSVGFWIIGTSYDRFNALFLAAVGIAGITLLIMIFQRNESAQSENVQAVHSQSRKQQASEYPSGRIRWAFISLPILVLFMNALSQSAITSFLALYTISLGLQGVGSFFSINALGMISSRFIMNRLVRRYGEFRMILINTIIFVCCIFFITQVSSIQLLLLLAFPAGFAMGSVAPIINTYLIQTLPGNKKGLANALYFSALDIGYGIGSVIWGVIAMKMGYVQVFYAASILQGAAIFMTVLQMKVLNKNSPAVVMTVNNHGNSEGSSL